MPHLLILVFLLLLVLWLLLTRADLSSLLLGLPFTLLALWSYRLQSHSPTPINLSLWGLLRFIKFFLWESLKGGSDIALRVWQRPIPITPAFYDYHLSIPPGPPRSFFIYCINLLPGTLSVQITQSNHLQLHVLDSQSDIAAELRKLEQHVCDLFVLDTTKESQ